MNVQVVREFPIRVLMMRHTGPYEQIGPKFDQLWSFIESNGIETLRTIGIYYDNPDFTPASQLRSAACFEVRGGFQTSNLAPGITLEEIPGGEYAMTRFVGPYDNLGPVWGEFTGYIENTLRRTIHEQNAAFEVYVNDASETPPSQLITDLYMPLV